MRGTVIRVSSCESGLTVVVARNSEDEDRMPGRGGNYRAEERVRDGGVVDARFERAGSFYNGRDVCLLTCLIDTSAFLASDSRRDDDTSITQSLTGATPPLCPTSTACRYSPKSALRKTKRSCDTRDRRGSGNNCFFAR